MDSREDFSKTLSLLAAVAEGDDSAINALMAKYYPKVRKMVRRRMPKDSLLRRQYETGDIVNEVLFKVFKSIKKRRKQGKPFNLTSGPKFEGWLVKEVLNMIRSKHRGLKASKRDASREKTMDSTAGQMAVDDLAAVGTHPGRKIERRIEAEQLLDRLTTQQREVFDLYAAGMTWAEIGKRIKKSPDAARMIYIRAVKFLKKSQGS